MIISAVLAHYVLNIAVGPIIEESVNSVLSELFPLQDAMLEDLPPLPGLHLALPFLCALLSIFQSPEAIYGGNDCRDALAYS